MTPRRAPRHMALAAGVLAAACQKTYAGTIMIAEDLMRIEL